MASITTADFKNGLGLKIKDKICTIVEFQHVKPGKGGAFVRYKTKDLRTGRVVEQTCNAGSKFESVTLTTTEMQYLYNDGDNYYFMNMETYDQIPLTYDLVEDAIKYIRENDTATVKFYKDNAFTVEAPNFVDLEVTETEPGVKGDTATNVTKAATVETGAVIQVPIFINEGEKIQIDTRTGDYLGRSK